jgi:cell division transport system permease protein
MKAWIEHNSHSFRLALERLLASPFASLVSVLVIGVAASLPTSLYVLLTNAERAASGMQERPEVTLFLKMEASREDGQRLARELARRKDVDKARFIDRDEGLRNLQQGGLGDLTAGLQDNPLPHVVVLSPRGTGPEALGNLVAELQKTPTVEQVVADQDWARRLDAIINFGRDLVWMLAAALGLALAVITGNTIRLQIFAAKDEIEVSRLIGATDRFIRRPFLYFGTLQGLLGGVAAWSMVTAGLMVLDGSVGRLTAAYGASFELAGLGVLDSAALLAIAALLGFIGAFLAVGHTLRQLEKAPN